MHAYFADTTRQSIPACNSPQFVRCWASGTTALNQHRNTGMPCILSCVSLACVYFYETRLRHKLQVRWVLAIIITFCSVVLLFICFSCHLGILVLLNLGVFSIVYPGCFCPSIFFVRMPGLYVNQTKTQTTSQVCVCSSSLVDSFCLRIYSLKLHNFL